MIPWSFIFGARHDPPVFGTTRTAAERRRNIRSSRPIPIPPPVRPLRPPLTIDFWYKLIWQHTQHDVLCRCDEGDYLRITTEADLESTEPVLCEAYMVWDDEQYHFTCWYDGASDTFTDFRNDIFGAEVYKLEIRQDTTDDGGKRMFSIQACFEIWIEKGREHLNHMIWAKKMNEDVKIGTRAWNEVEFSDREKRELGFIPDPDNRSSTQSVPQSWEF